MDDTYPPWSLKEKIRSPISMLESSKGHMMMLMMMEARQVPTSNFCSAVDDIDTYYYQAYQQGYRRFSVGAVDTPCLPQSALCRLVQVSMMQPRHLIKVSPHLTKVNPCTSTTGMASCLAIFFNILLYLMSSVK